MNLMWGVMCHKKKYFLLVIHNLPTILGLIEQRIMDLDQYLEKMITNTIVIWILLVEKYMFYKMNRTIKACYAPYFKMKWTINEPISSDNPPNNKLNDV